jgi:hypothetical protein
MVERDWYRVGVETFQGLLAMTESSPNHLKISWDKKFNVVKLKIMFSCTRPSIDVTVLGKGSTICDNNTKASVIKA